MTMTQAELNDVLEKHKKWLNGKNDGERAELVGVDLSGADLSSANLSGAKLSGADLSYANLSGAQGLISPIDYMTEHFEQVDEGYIVYKCFDAAYASPKEWIIAEGSIIEEELNSCRTDNCGCGINVAPLEWVKGNYPKSDTYKLLIKWEWLPGVVVPYNTDGKIRCARAQIIGKVEEE